jgi:hypothetical protein
LRTEEPYLNILMNSLSVKGSEYFPRSIIPCGQSDHVEHHNQTLCVFDSERVVTDQRL